MYFDTIHEVPEFDAILDPENGYASCWETETDIGGDDDFGSLIFADLDGDSASVICLDDKQAQELCERWKNRQATASAGNRHMQVTDVPTTSYHLERTYDEIVDKPEEHVYEEVDDCVNAYQIFMSNGSPNESPDNEDYSKIAVKHHRKTQPLPQKSKRANSLPTNQLHNTSPYRHQRKYSDCSEYSRLNRRNHVLSEEKTPVYSSLPPPLPPPNGTTNTDYAHLFKYPEKTPSPEHREEPLGSKGARQSVVLKHKGKSYVLPISDDPNKKPRRHSNCSGTQASPKHTAMQGTGTTNLLQTSPSTMSQMNCHMFYSVVPRSASMSFQAQNSIRRSSSNPSRHSPEHKDSTTKRTKSKHLSTQSAPPTANSQQHVTLYGVL